jgi:RNA polymerase sigma factor (sigma-70 family)
MSAASDDGRPVARSVADDRFFEQVFRRHGAGVHRYFARRLGDDLADDLTSELFLAALRGREGFLGQPSAILPWLYGIAGNLVAQHAREYARHWRLLAAIQPAQDAPSHEESSDDRVSAEAMRGALVDALQRLQPADRDVLLLTAWEQLNQNEIAAALSIPVGTVRSRLHRARQQVRGQLDTPTVGPAGNPAVKELFS